MMGGPPMPPSGVPPPRPPGMPGPGPRGEDRSRGVRFDGPPKIRSLSCDDVLRGRAGAAAAGQDDEEASADEANAPDVASWPHHAGRGHHIQVAVRCRPLHHQEAKEGTRPIIKVDNKTVVLEDPQITAADDYLRINKSKERRYAFDEAFHEGASTQQVFERTARLLIGGVLQGFNATVFAYGATGAGKTHTMLGNPSEPGIMMLTLNDLFSEVALQKEERVTEVKCSFLEVYNENIRDLLKPDADYLDIREDPVKGMCVAGISEVGGLESAEEIMVLLHQANKHRSTESTGANVTSSRSHAVLQVVVEQRDRTAGIVAQVNVGKLSMIDLAGSERASQTNNQGKRMIEGANINRSLLALGNCITALSSAVGFVPYRDSKMTRLLKDSLGGNCRTAMIANVSPSHLNYEDTHNTLKYAKRASNIKTKAVRNVVRVNSHVSKYSEIIKELRTEITELKSRLAEAAQGVSVAPSMSVENCSSEGYEMDSEATDGIIMPMSMAVDEHSTNWKSELMQNFEERVKIKRRLIDFAHQAQAQQVQKSEAQVGISQWESARVPGETPCRDAPKEITALQEKLRGLKADIAQTEESTRELEKMLVENQVKAEKLQADLPSRVQNKDMRSFLELVSRIYVMEVENMDLQEMNDVVTPLLQQKDLEAEALRLQIQMRDRMIEDQETLLMNEGVSSIPYPEGWVDISSKPSRYISSPLVYHEDRRGGSASSDEECTTRAGNARRDPPPGPQAGPRSLSQPPEGARGGFVLPPLSPSANRGRERGRDPPELGGVASERVRRRNPGLSPLRTGGSTPPGRRIPSGASGLSGASSVSKAPPTIPPSPQAKESDPDYEAPQARRPLDIAGHGYGPSSGAVGAGAGGGGSSSSTSWPRDQGPPSSAIAGPPSRESPHPSSAAGAGTGAGAGAGGLSGQAAAQIGSDQSGSRIDDTWKEGDPDATILPSVQGVAVADRRIYPRPADFSSNNSSVNANNTNVNGHAPGPGGPMLRQHGSFEGGSNARGARQSVGISSAVGQRRSRKKNRRDGLGSNSGVRGKEYDQAVPLMMAPVSLSAAGPRESPDHDASGSDWELIAEGSRMEMVSVPSKDSAPTAAERKGILQKLNAKAKPPSAPGSDSGIGGPGGSGRNLH